MVNQLRVSKLPHVWTKRPHNRTTTN